MTIILGGTHEFYIGQGDTPPDIIQHSESQAPGSSYISGFSVLTPLVDVPRDLKGFLDPVELQRVSINAKPDTLHVVVPVASASTESGRSHPTNVGEHYHTGGPMQALFPISY